MKELRNTYQLWQVMIVLTVILTIISSHLMIKYTWHIETGWSYEEHSKVWVLIIREALAFRNETYFWYRNYLIENNDLINYCFHIGISVILSIVGSIFLIFKLLWVKGGRDKAIHISGAKLYKNSYATKHAHKALKKDLKNSKNLGVNLHPSIQITKEQEVGNVLVEGAQGSGKSTVIKPLVNCIVNSGDRMLIYDAKREYTELFHKRSHLLLSPSDRRSLCWDIAADVTSPEIALEIASCFINQTGKDPIWSNGARLILAGCMVTLMNTQPDWSWTELKEFLDKPVKELKVYFEKHYPDAAKLISEDSKTTDSFIMEMVTKLNWLGYLAKVWTKETKYKFSVTKWFAGKYNLQSLIVPNNPKYSSMSSPLCSAVLSIIVRELLALPDNEERKFWFVLDELADLPKTDALEKWLALGRSKGARTIAGTQNISQLQSIYGDKNTETLTSLFSNVIALKIGNSFDTAKKVADNLGKRIVKRGVVSFDKEDNKSTSYQQLEEHIVRPEQLIQLPLPSNKGIMGFLSITGRNAVYELIWPYPKLEKIAEAYVPVDFSEKSFETMPNKLKRGSRGRNRAC